MSIRHALALSLFWILLAFAFNTGLYYSHGPDVALEFFASYLLEKGLSIDNVFVFYVIFENFEIPERYQRRVLQWGIFGALLMRALFISIGIQLLESFHFVIWIFGALLVFTGIKLFFEGDDDESTNFGEKWYIKLIQNNLRYVDDFAGGKFFVSIQKQTNPPVFQTHVTRLFLALVTVELMDAVFALDSIPAILSLTHNHLVVYTSNIFAILGLRALYGAIQGMVNQFHYLKHGLAIILVFVGLKMLLAAYIKVSLVLALGFIVAVMTISIVASILRSNRLDAKAQKQTNSDHEPPGDIHVISFQ